MKEKEELRKKFEAFCNAGNISCERCISVDDWTSVDNEVFDFFYSEIEARDKQIDKCNAFIDKLGSNDVDQCTKISHLESTLEAAEEVIQASGDLSTYNTHHNIVEKYKDKLNAYHQLKTKSQS